MQQINDKKYETELMTAGVRTIYKYGVAFSGKKVEVTEAVVFDLRRQDW